MKKVILIVVLIILTLFTAGKIYNFVIINKFHDATENFTKEKNRYYAVTVIKDGVENRKEEIFVKDNLFKYCENKEKYNYLEWKNLDTNENYAINTFKKEIYLNCDLLINMENSLPHISYLISLIYEDDENNIKNIFNVKYIIPSKYNDKKCYKIITKDEIIVIDKDTYLPVYSSIKTVNTGEDYSKVEYTYEFEIGNVTEEDMTLPDLTEYKTVKSK